MGRLPTRTKQQKAEYDRKRKADAIKERRLTKPLKLFFKNKYAALYDEFMEFFNQMDNKYPEKKDLTKTQMFKDFLKPYAETSIENTSVVEHPAQEEEYPILASLLEPLVQPASTEPTSTSASTEPASTEPTFTSASTEPASTEPASTEPLVQSASTEPASTEPLVQSASTEPASTEPLVQAASTEPVSQPLSSQRNIISELIDELFGQGDLDQYLQHVENIDEGIDVNILDELRLDYLDFDFEQETVGF